MADEWMAPVAAPLELRSDVVCSWRATVAGTHRLVPDGCVDVLWLDTGPILVCGPELKAWEFTLPPGLHAVGVRLRPGVARRAFRTDMHHLTNDRVRLGDLAGSRVERLASEQMGGSIDPLPILETLVGRLLRATDPHPIDSGIAEGALAARPGSIGELAGEVGLSPRQLQRRSHRLFGYGLSTLNRIVRFQRFVVRAQCQPEATLARLAGMAGYSDQAHLVRDCRSITGLTPTQFLSQHDRTFPDMSDPYKTEVGRFATTVA